MSAVLDASAILAWLQDEPGSDVVEEHLRTGAVCSAVSWSEVAQKVAAGDASWPVARALLESYDLEVAPLDGADAEAAAGLWRRGAGLSLADRCCLALAGRLGTVAVTADAVWGSGEGIEQIR